MAKLLSLLDGNKTYLVSGLLAAGGLVACYFGQLQLGSTLLGLSGLGASIRSAIKKVEPRLPE